MSEPSSSLGLAAIFKLYGLKAVIGMVGAALLYFIMPPKTPDGHFSQHEFVTRLASAGIASMFFGDWAVQMLMDHAAWLHAADHRPAVYLIVGAPAWWIGRGIALWFHNRRTKDICQMIGEAKKALKR